MTTTYHGVCNQINTTCATSREGTAYPSGATEFISVFQWSSCYSIFSFMCMFCISLFVLLYFLFWSLCCMFFFDIRILIAPLASSNSYYIVSTPCCYQGDTKLHNVYIVNKLLPWDTGIHNDIFYIMNFKPPRGLIYTMNYIVNTSVINQTTEIIHG